MIVEVTRENGDFLIRRLIGDMYSSRGGTANEIDFTEQPTRWENMIVLDETIQVYEIDLKNGLNLMMDYIKIEKKRRHCADFEQATYS